MLTGFDQNGVWLAIPLTSGDTSTLCHHSSAPKVLNLAGQALHQAASNARASRSFISASHRARLTRMDTLVAIKATAHQLACLVYAMLTNGQPYVEKGIETFEARRQDSQLRALQSKARKLGFNLVQAI